MLQEEQALVNTRILKMFKNELGTSTEEESQAHLLCLQPAPYCVSNYKITHIKKTGESHSTYKLFFLNSSTLYFIQVFPQCCINKPESQMLHWGHYQHWSVTSSPPHLSPGGAAALLLLTLQSRHDYKRISMKSTTLPSYLIQSRLTQSQHSTATLMLHPLEVPKPQFKHCVALVHSEA